MIFDPLFEGDRVRLSEGDGDLPDAAPGGVLGASAVREADPAAVPPEIRTRSGEIVFVTSVRQAELARFCTDNGIPLRSRPDVWGDLLEPFLDTEFDRRTRAATLERLAAAGVDATEAAAIRERVRPLVVAYNSVHWDWFHLGLADLLVAARSDLVPEELRIPPEDLRAFRAWATDIAARPDRLP
ncbi:hypothetical protein OG594_35480 [Streptomyces sp. NBC_01214]|uniref:hypothetical protein n=1 Tax=Streptomyces sp. NBC_01214 TaxID=2903777 RepID=UPI002258E902|nr:hypothetical protein [Streptomyces sp. NBC_01214]MCX4806866.1 hypothetical protein [Streptomyces sp. NBC_01214]